MLIVFDGPNCSGKTTLIEKINKRLIGKYNIFFNQRTNTRRIWKVFKRKSFNL